MSRFIPEKEQPTQPPPILIDGLRIAGEKQNISAIGETEIALPELDRDRNQLQIDNVAPIRALDGTIIEPLGIPSLTFDEIDAIVAFLEALTDDRVVHQSAPFDHPQIFVPNGHPGSSSWTIDVNGEGLADDVMIEIPAVGAIGSDPLPGFLQGIFGPTH